MHGHPWYVDIGQEFSKYTVPSNYVCKLVDVFVGSCVWHCQTMEGSYICTATIYTMYKIANG